MLYPPVAELLKKVDSRYLLVNLVAHRARQIAAEAEAFQEDLPEKPVTMAIEEVADGELSATVKEEYMKWCLPGGRVPPSGKTDGKDGVKDDCENRGFRRDLCH